MTKAVAPELILQNIINNPNAQRLQESLSNFASTFANKRKQQRLVDLSRTASDPRDPQGQINALNELAVLNPQAAQTISQATQRRQETLVNLQKARKEKAKSDLTFSASYGQAIKNAKTNEQKDSVYQRFLEDAQSRGLELDPKVTPQNYYEGMEEEYINPIIDRAESLGLIETPQAKSTVGKIQEDLEAGRLTPELAGRAIEKAVSTKPTTVVNIAGKAPTGFRFEDPNDPASSLVAIKGGPAERVSTESAAKIALVKRGIQDLGKFEKAIFDEKGNVKNSLLAQLQVPIKLPKSEARNLQSLMSSVINSKLRIESGAAVPETEVKRDMVNFLPSPLDSKATVKSKLDRLRAILNAQIEEVSKGRSPTLQEEPKKLKVRRFNPQTGRIE